MNNNYAIFMKNMNDFKAQLEKANNDSYKKVLKALKDFIDAVDSMNDLNPEEANEFMKIVSSSWIFSAITKSK